MTPSEEALSRVGEYEVKGIIGEGGMGVVYEGVNPVIGKRVAIKLLRKSYAQNPDEAQRLLEEARAVNAIGHRGIVDIFAFGTLPDGRSFLVMEHLAGAALSAHLRTHLRLPQGDVLRILDEMLGALDAAHRAGVIHRDLKPSNVFLVAATSGDAYVKVLDFGLAKRALFVGGETPQTQVGKVMGTPAYMAPEQARGEPVSARTDLYAVGVMTYEMLTGQKPFRGGTMHETLVMHQFDAPVPPSVLVSNLDPGLERLVLSMLEKDPAARPASAAAVRELVRGLRRTPELDRSQLELPPIDEYAQQQPLTRTPLASPSPGSPLSLPTLSLGRATAALPPAIDATVPLVAQPAEPPPAAAPKVVSRTALGLVALVVGLLLIAVAAQIVLTSQPPAPTAPPVVEAVPPEVAVKPPPPEPTPPSAPEVVAPTAPVADARERAAGYLSVDAMPWGEVFVDGRMLGETPLGRARVSAGSHVVVVKNPGSGAKARRQVTIAPGAHVPLRLKLE